MTNTAHKLDVPTCAKARQTTIPIGKDFRLIADAYCWTLQRHAGVRKNRRTGNSESHWRPVSYHPTIELAVAHLAELRLRLSGAQSFAELLQEQKETRKLITNALAPLDVDDAQDNTPLRV